MQWLIKIILDYFLSKIPGVISNILGYFKTLSKNKKVDNAVKKIEQADNKHDLDDSFDELP